MNILVFTDAFPNPSETFILHQINGLIARGHEVTICAARAVRNAPVLSEVQRHDLLSKVRYRPEGRSGWGNLIASGVQRLGLLTAASCFNVIRYGRFARTGRLLGAAVALHDRPAFDVVIAHFGPVGELALAVRAQGWFSGPLITFFHGNDIGTRDAVALRRKYPRVFAEAELILAVSEYFRSRLSAAGIPDARLGLHRMGIELATFAPRAGREVPGIRLVTIGRLVAKKGIDTAIRALALLREDPRWSYHVVGDGPMSGELRQLVVDLGLVDRVEFHGWRDQQFVSGLLSRSHILMAPSRTVGGDIEGCPVSIAEGLAAGMAVCSTRHSGIPEMVVDGHTGLLCDEDDVSGLAGNVRQLLDNQALRVRLAEHGVRHVREHWDVEHWNDALVRHLLAISAQAQLRS